MSKLKYEFIYFVISHVRDYEQDRKYAQELGKMYVVFNNMFVVGVSCQLINNNVNIREVITRKTFKWESVYVS